jgi:hypothetical protein
VIRTCDGTDPNLTREIPATEYDAARHNLSPWNSSAKPGIVVIQCACGLRFDDVKRMVIYPHVRVGGTVIITQGRQYEDGPVQPRQIRYA